MPGLMPGQSAESLVNKIPVLRLRGFQSLFPLLHFRYGPNTCSQLFTVHQSMAQNLSDMWRSTFKIGEAQLRSVTEIAPKSLFLCVDWISVAETQMFLCTKRPSSEERGGTAVFAGYWFHCEMITEEVAQKFHTDDVLPLRSASDWMKQIFNQSEALPDLGNNMSFYRETLVACSSNVSYSLWMDLLYWSSKAWTAPRLVIL